MALIVNSTETANMGRNVLYATMSKTGRNMGLDVNTNKSNKTPNYFYMRH